jgi:hypothetical protein
MIEVPSFFVAGTAEWVPYMVPGSLEKMQTHTLGCPTSLLTRSPLLFSDL